jgi:PAS domain S-box-containing protein
VVTDTSQHLLPEGADGPLSRPVVSALLESQPVPAMLMTRDGGVVAPNAQAARFVVETPGGPAVMATDGTSLWTILEARSAEADPFYDVRVRLRGADGESLETTMSIVPVRGPSGELAAAMLFVLHVAGERVVGAPTSIAGVGRLQEIVERIGMMVNADGVYVAEFDRESLDEALVLAYWSPETTQPAISGFRLHATPAASFAGRRVVCIPRGLPQAYPDVELLSEYQAYAGIALKDTSGRMAGCLAAVWKDALEDPSGIVAVLTIAAAWAGRALSEDATLRELRESEQRYGALFEGSLVPMLLIEPSTTQIVDANPAACELYGFPRDEFLSMSILQVEALSIDGIQAELQRAAEGTRGHFIGQHLLAGGRLLDVEVTIGPMRVAGRRLLYCMINDVTERRRMEAELERRKRNLELAVGQRTEDLLRANAELQRASMARDHLLGDLAHELTTSLQTITGFSELLLDDQADHLTDEQRRQVQLVRDAADRLGSFATSLDESREAHSMPASDLEEFDIVGLVESIVVGLGLFAQDKGLDLAFHADTRPLPVRTDRYKVQQILLNILSNGIRYTDSGSVTATVAQDGDGSVLVAIADTGTGLAPEAVAGLFAEPAAAFPKAGIGLPTSQRIAREIGGSIDVLSIEGAGSTFTLRLPPTAAVPLEPHDG